MSPEELKELEDQVFHNPYSIKDVPLEILIEYPQLCEGVITNYYNSDELKEMIDCIPVEALIANPWVFDTGLELNDYLLESIPEEVLQACPEVYEMALNYSMYALECIPEDILEENPKLCEIAIDRNGNAIQYIPEDILREHPEWYELAISDDDPEAIQYIPEDILEENPKLCEIAIDRDVTFIEYIPVEILKNNPKLCEMAIWEDYSAIRLIPAEILKENFELCEMAVEDNCRAIEYIPTEILKENFELCETAVEDNCRAIEYIPTEILKENFELCETAIKRDWRAMEYVPKEVLEMHPEICISILEIDENIIGSSFFNNARNIREVAEYLYGEDVEEYLELKKNNYFDISKNYDESQMDLLYLKMIRAIGIDSVKEILSIPNLNKEQIERYSLNNSELLENLFETKYELTGKDGMVFDIFRNFPAWQYNNVSGKNSQFEIYKNLNKLLENSEKLDLDNLLRNSIINSGFSINEDIDSKIEKLSSQVERKLIDLNLASLENEIKNKLAKRGIVPLQIDAITIIIKQNMKESIIKQGIKVDKEEIIKTLENDLTIENHSEYVSSNKDNILSVVNTILNNEKDMKLLNYSAFDMLNEFKEKSAKGWIRNILNTPKELSKEQFETLQLKLNRTLEYSFISKPKQKNLKDIYKILIEKEVPEVLTYEKIEIMFGGITEPYSEKFKEFFAKNKDEILRNSEYYYDLSQIHNSFDTYILPVLLDSELTIDNVINVFNGLEFKYSSVLNGNEELAKLATSLTLSQEYFDIAQDIFEKSKKREEISIPPVKTNTHKKYRGRTLRIDDPLVLFAGTITDCCQELGNCGESSMIHSAIEKNGNVFVVEKVDENGTPIYGGKDNPTSIVVQSWVWRNKDRLCFDNIELKEKNGSGKIIIFTENEKSEIVDIYREAGELALLKDEKHLSELLENGKITQETYDEWILKEVTVGMRFTELNLNDLPFAKIVVPAEDRKLYTGISSDRLYSDARRRQVIIASIAEEKQEEIRTRRKSRENNISSKETQKPEFYDGRSEE